MNRREFSKVVASMAALSVAPRYALAQSQVESLRILVGYPAGGTTDATARMIGDALTHSYAGRSLVENRPGAAGRFSMGEVVKGPADGSVMVLQPETVLTLVPHVDPKVAAFTLADLAPVSPCALVRHTFAVGPMVPESVKTLTDFLEWAKKTPELANYGSPGSSTPNRFLISELSRATGVALNHVPYKGSAAGVTNVLGGQIAAMSSPVGDWLPHMNTGKVRLLAVASATRSKLVPDVPTFAELGFPELLADETSGVLMPKDTQPEILNIAARAIAAAVAEPQIVEAMTRVGLEPTASTPAEYRRYLDQNFARWGERVRASGFRPEI